SARSAPTPASWHEAVARTRTDEADRASIRRDYARRMDAGDGRGGDPARAMPPPPPPPPPPPGVLPPPSVGPPTLPPVVSSTNDDPWTPFGQPRTPTVRPLDAPTPLPGTVRPAPTAAPRPIGGRAVIAQSMLLVAAAATVLGTWTTWNRRNVLAG